MRLRIITATRGDSPYWAETVSSVKTAAIGSEHVVIAPESRLNEVNVSGALRCFPQEKQGLYPKLNQALRKVGDWDAFTWINDDDVLKAPGFTSAVQLLESSAATDIVYGNVSIIDGKSHRLGTLPVAKRPSDLCTLFRQGIIPFAQPGTIIRRAIWEQLRGLDESYRIVGDMDFFIRALLVGAQFKYIAAEVAAFRLRSGQLSKSRIEVGDETARALEPLGSVPTHRFARLRFRVCNIPTYIHRIRKFGWISMRQLYDRTA